MLAAISGSAALAQGPLGDPKQEGTIKQTASVDLAPVFERQMKLIEKRRASWLARAEKAKPRLVHTPKTPVSVVKVEKDTGGFQGWKTTVSAPLSSVLNRPFQPGDSFILDFGEHLVGHFVFSLRSFDIPVDAPVRLSFVFGEVPAEVAEPLDPYKGSLARSWLQDEVVNLDDVPQTATLPRRYAFRFAKVTVVSSSRFSSFGFSEIHADSLTSANESRLLPFSAPNADDAAIDRVARATLRDCMQTVFEDGPKRDRRLWLGDLRLEALANYATYRNYDLVKRSLYLLAAKTSTQGLVSTALFERPEPARAGNNILDYTALFAATVLEYLEASGDRQTAEDLWPLVLKQLDFTLEPVNSQGLFGVPKGWWLFVDHSPIDKQASEQAIVIFGLKATLKLASKIGKADEVTFIPRIMERMVTAARTTLWDDALGMFVSGPKRQISWASQSWMVLAGVPTIAEGRRALSSVMNSVGAQKPVTPYLYHYVVEALLAVGLHDDAWRLLRSYWGGMIKKGADTFWEAYVPENDLASPYGSHLMNSYCHAWSCSPAYLLRRETKSPHREGP